MTSPVLVGRDEELDRLVAAATSPPSVTVVEGEAGIGKTRLVTELTRRPELAGRRVLTGGCARIREPFPLGPLLDALRAAGGHLRAVPLSPVAGALRPLMPELADLLPPAPDRLDDKIAERHRVFRGLACLIGSLGPAVLVLEDMHWADEQSVEFLGYLLSDPPPGLGVVLTFRGEEVGPAVRALTARLPGGTAREHLVLRPFGTAATRELAASVLDAERVSEDFAAYLCERTSGLPFAIQELLALLRARGTLVRRGGGWSRKAIDELDVPSGVRDSVLERVSRLSPAAREVAEAASVLQVMATIPVLTAVCRAGGEDALRGLDEALERGLLIERAGRVGYRHLLAVQAVYDDVPLPRRQELHRRAASALEGLDPVPLGQVAHHLRHAGLTGAWVDAAERAADRAAALGDDSEVIRLLADVLRDARLDPARRARLSAKLGWACVDTPGKVDAAALLDAALEHDLPRPLRGELLFLLALNLETAGRDPHRQWRAYAEAVEHLGSRPELAVRAMLGLSMPLAPGVPPAEHVAWLDRALRTLPEVGDRALRTLVYGKAAMVLTTMGDPRWAELSGRMLELTGEPTVSQEVNAFRSAGVNACYPGHHARSERLLTSALRAVTEHDLGRVPEMTCRACLAVLSYARGRWDGLPEETAFLIGRFADSPRHRLLPEAVAACLALHRGEPDAARRALDEAVDACLDMGAIDLLPLPLGALARLAAAQGDAGAVLEKADRARAAWEAKRLWPAAVRALPALAAALIAGGGAGAAAALAARVEERLRGLDAPLGPAALAHARGLIALAAGRRHAAADHLLAAADAYDALLSPYEAAQAREAAADCLSRLAGPAAAAHLQRALAAYAGLGARWDLDRASRLARAQGVAPPARHRSGPRGYGSALSPRESEVAGLAAGGLTNKEIARALFLSTKTVDKHLSAALRKLGLRSRTALARRLPD
ncbi:LuxR family transcriptional regulator [Bailinhaonella thermotolerans]|uniref:LuxR family transcriptional regulator n=2 Tax=Bailinhaonella thermotolerans TaxID=1070861 RepID=A0A3A4BEY1_9ACTN|nr:LuxR family transcriptional regulator [Bailinhaonella thermotolerans]